MSKDKSSLDRVSKYFTEATLAHVVAGVCEEREDRVEISSWDFGHASKKGDGYLSTVDRVVVKAKVANEEKQINLVVKSMPNNIGRRKTFRSAEFFYNEIAFYSEIATRFRQFLKSKNQSSLIIIPECLASHSDGENDYIALEDANVHGFSPLVRQNCLGFKESAFIWRALARFHGVSFAYKDQHKNDFEAAASKLRETYARTDLYESWYKRYDARVLEVARDALAKEYPGSDGEKRFNSYAAGELYGKSADFRARGRAPSSVVNHGDTWPPNFLTRTKDSGDIEVLMLDFQLAKCTSPVLDLSFFLYSCTDKKLRDEHFDELLRIYHDELSRTIKVLGSDPAKLYPWDVFMREVEEQFVYGLVFGMEAVIVSTLPEDEVVDLDAIQDEVDIADVIVIKNLTSRETRRRLADIILHAADKGYL